MLSNGAAAVEEFIRDHRDQHLALVLRPCELRALREIEKRRPGLTRPTNRDGMLIICVDCPGTFPAAEYTRRLALHRAEASMIRVGMNYRKQKTYAPEGIRFACELCNPCRPEDADVTIGTFGIVTEGILLVIARDEKTDQRLRLSDVTDGIAEEQQVEFRDIMLGKFAHTRADRRAELLQTQQAQTENFSDLLAAFARCTLCAECLDACPLYNGELTDMLGVGQRHQGATPLLPELVRVSRWLASCAGCGMCQEACRNAVPLTSLITTMHLRIQQDLRYHAGNQAEALPWSA
jgi:formate dehydrogenase subunit beta